MVKRIIYLALIHFSPISKPESGDDCLNFSHGEVVMTVGIAARCNTQDEEEKVVVAADRMITMGAGSQIEYEHTNSKIFELVDEKGISAVGIGAGETGYIEEILNELRTRVEKSEAGNVKEIGEIATDVFQKVRRKNIEDKILSCYGMTFNDYLEKQGNFNDEFIDKIQNKVEKAKREVNRVEILICGADKDGGHIFSIENGKLTEWDRQSFFAIGNGEESALTPFLKHQYNDDRTVEKALVSVMEGKIRAEEVRGVGSLFDLAVISADQICQMKEEEKYEIKDLVAEITSMQETKREEMVDDWDYQFADEEGEKDEE